MEPVNNFSGDVPRDGDLMITMREGSHDEIRTKLRWLLNVHGFKTDASKNSRLQKVLVEEKYNSNHALYTKNADSFDFFTTKWSEARMEAIRSVRWEAWQTIVKESVATAKTIQALYATFVSKVLLYLSEDPNFTNKLVHYLDTVPKFSFELQESERIHLLCMQAKMSADLNLLEMHEDLISNLPSENVPICVDLELAGMCAKSGLFFRYLNAISLFIVITPETWTNQFSDKLCRCYNAMLKMDGTGLASSVSDSYVQKINSDYPKILNPKIYFKKSSLNISEDEGNNFYLSEVEHDRTNSTCSVPFSRLTSIPIFSISLSQKKAGMLNAKPDMKHLNTASFERAETSIFLVNLSKPEKLSSDETGYLSGFAKDSDLIFQDKDPNRSFKDFVKTNSILTANGVPDFTNSTNDGSMRLEPLFPMCEDTQMFYQESTKLFIWIGLVSNFKMDLSILSADSNVSYLVNKDEFPCPNEKLAQVHDNWKKDNSIADSAESKVVAVSMSVYAMLAYIASRDGLSSKNLGAKRKSDFEYTLPFSFGESLTSRMQVNGQPTKNSLLHSFVMIEAGRVDAELTGANFTTKNITNYMKRLNDHTNTRADGTESMLKIESQIADFRMYKRTTPENPFIEGNEQLFKTFMHNLSFQEFLSTSFFSGLGTESKLHIEAQNTLSLNGDLIKNEEFYGQFMSILKDPQIFQTNFKNFILAGQEKSTSAIITTLCSLQRSNDREKFFNNKMISEFSMQALKPLHCLCMSMNGVAWELGEIERKTRKFNDQSAVQGLQDIFQKSLKIESGVEIGTSAQNDQLMPTTPEPSAITKFYKSQRMKAHTQTLNPLQKERNFLPNNDKTLQIKEDTVWTPSFENKNVSEPGNGPHLQQRHEWPSHNSDQNSTRVSQSKNCPQASAAFNLLGSFNQSGILSGKQSTITNNDYSENQLGSRESSGFERRGESENFNFPGQNRSRDYSKFPGQERNPDYSNFPGQDKPSQNDESPNFHDQGGRENSGNAGRPGRPGAPEDPDDPGDFSGNNSSEDLIQKALRIARELIKTKEEVSEIIPHLGRLELITFKSSLNEDLQIMVQARRLLEKRQHRFTMNYNVQENTRQNIELILRGMNISQSLSVHCENQLKRVPGSTNKTRPQNVTFIDLTKTEDTSSPQEQHKQYQERANLDSSSRVLMNPDDQQNFDFSYSKYSDKISIDIIALGASDKLKEPESFIHTFVKLRTKGVGKDGGYILQPAGFVSEMDKKMLRVRNLIALSNTSLTEMIKKSTIMNEWKNTKLRKWKGTEFTLGLNLFYAILTYRQATARNKTARMTDVADIANYMETYLHVCYLVLSDVQNDALNHVIDKRLSRGQFEPKADNSVYELIKLITRSLDHPLEESLEYCRRDFEGVFLDMIKQHVQEGQSHIVTRIVCTFTNCVEILHQHKSLSELSWTESGSRQKRYVNILTKVIEKYTDTRFVARFEARIQNLVTKRDDVSYFALKTYCDVLLETEDICQDSWKTSSVISELNENSKEACYFAPTGSSQKQKNPNNPGQPAEKQKEVKPCKPCEVLEDKIVVHKMEECAIVKREMKKKSKEDFEEWMRPLCARTYLYMFMNKLYKKDGKGTTKKPDTKRKDSDKKTKNICRNFQKGECSKDAKDCKYDHPEECYYWKRWGNCKFNEKCNKFHDPNSKPSENKSETSKNKSTHATAVVGPSYAVKKNSTTLNQTALTTAANGCMWKCDKATSHESPECETFKIKTMNVTEFYSKLKTQNPEYAKEIAENFDEIYKVMLDARTKTDEKLAKQLSSKSKGIGHVSTSETLTYDFDYDEAAANEDFCLECEEEVDKQNGGSHLIGSVNSEKNCENLFDFDHKSDHFKPESKNNSISKFWELSKATIKTLVFNFKYFLALFMPFFHLHFPDHKVLLALFILIFLLIIQDRFFSQKFDRFQTNFSRVRYPDGSILDVTPMSCLENDDEVKFPLFRTHVFENPNVELVCLQDSGNLALRSLIDYRAYQAVFDKKKYPLKKSSLTITGVGDREVKNMGSANIRLFINGKIVMMPFLVCDLQSSVTDLLLSQRYLASIFDSTTVSLRTKMMHWSYRKHLRPRGPQKSRRKKNAISVPLLTVNECEKIKANRSSEKQLTPPILKMSTGVFKITSNREINIEPGKSVFLSANKSDFSSPENDAKENDVCFIEPVVPLEDARHRNYKSYHLSDINSDKPNIEEADIEQIFDRSSGGALLHPTIASSTDKKFELTNTTVNAIQIPKNSLLGLISYGRSDSDITLVKSYEQWVENVSKRMQELDTDLTIEKEKLEKLNIQDKQNPFQKDSSKQASAALTSKTNKKRTPQQIYDDMKARREWLNNNLDPNIPRKFLTIDEAYCETLKITTPRNKIRCFVDRKLSKEVKERIKGMILKYPTVFYPEQLVMGENLPKNITVPLVENWRDYCQTKVWQQSKKYSPQERRDFDLAISDLVSLGALEVRETPCINLCPAFLVRKSARFSEKLNKLEAANRLVVDCRGLNHMVIGSTSGLLTSHQVSLLLADAKMVSSFDLQKLFDTITQTDERFQDLQNIISPNNVLYNFKSVVQGAKASMEQATAVINSLIREIKYDPKLVRFVVYADDLLVVALTDDVEAHLEAVEALIKMLNTHKLSISPKSMSIAVRAFNYLGKSVLLHDNLMISTISRKHMENLVNLKPPTTLANAQSIISSFNFYCKNIINFSDRAAGLQS